MKFLGWLKFFLLGIVTFLVFLPSPSFSQIDVNVDVDTEIGPQFSPTDKLVLSSCFSSDLKSKFPYGFVSNVDQLSAPDKDCPSLTIFNNTFEACYLIDIYELIEPGIVLGFYIYAIIHL